MRNKLSQLILITLNHSFWIESISFLNEVWEQTYLPMCVKTLMLLFQLKVDVCGGVSEEGVCVSPGSFVMYNTARLATLMAHFQRAVEQGSFTLVCFFWFCFDTVLIQFRFSVLVILGGSLDNLCVTRNEFTFSWQ